MLCIFPVSCQLSGCTCLWHNSFAYRNIFLAHIMSTANPSSFPKLRNDITSLDHAKLTWLGLTYGRKVEHWSGQFSSSRYPFGIQAKEKIKSMFWLLWDICYETNHRIKYAWHQQAHKQLFSLYSIYRMTTKYISLEKSHLLCWTYNRSWPSTRHLNKHVID